MAQVSVDNWRQRGAASRSARRVRDAIKAAISYVLMFLVAVILLYPFFWLAGSSFQPSSGNIFAFPPPIVPHSPSLENYHTIFTELSFLRYFFNSVFISAIEVTGSLFFSTLAAYPLARKSFPGRDVIFGIVLMTFLMPSEIGFIPVFIIIKDLGWVDTYQGVFVPGLVSAFTIFLMRQAFLSLPSELEDAAEIDGAGQWSTFWQVAVPLVAPAAAAAAIFGFVGSWSALLWPLVVLSSEQLFTLPLGILQIQNAFYGDFRQIAAGSMVATVPIVVFFLATQRYFISGLTQGALKA